MPFSATRRSRRASLSALTVATAVVATLGVQVAQPAAAQANPHWPSPEQVVAPIDPQRWENPDDMTWQDLRPVPGVDWSDPNREPTERTFRAALVLADYQDVDFAVTRPTGSDIFGNPRMNVGVPRENVAGFYRDFLNQPQPLNHRLTMHGYWMETSNGRYGVTLDSFGAYRLPGKKHEYGLNEWNQQENCPSGDDCGRDLRADVFAPWRAEHGEDVAEDYDVVFVLTAGNDESSTWQEFGEMRFADCESIPAEFGPPDPALPKCSTTRYVPWTSWGAAANHWPNARGRSTTQAESSGLGTFSHELSHVLSIGDNYNNPFGDPPRRSYTGPWSMMSRGSFNGPGGPHTRYHVPATQGGSVGVHQTLRDKLRLDAVGEEHVLRLSREALKSSGVAVITVTARSVPMGVEGRDGLVGVNVAMEADRGPACDPGEDPLCDGGDFDNYTLEVIDRMGYDSFVPDAGVMLAKTKDQDRAPFVWTVDANPQDIRTVDFVRPDGTKQYMTIGDYRQLSDALFHAGTRSGSEFEYVDEANRLHFYILDVQRDDTGVLSYRLAVRSLDGSGPHTRDVALRSGRPVGKVPARVATCRFPLANTGTVRPVGGEQPEDVTPYVSSDVYRLSASVSGRGWSATLPSEVVDAEAGSTVSVPVHAVRDPAGSPWATVRLEARSESDNSVVARSTCRLSILDTFPWR
ncbi:M6 family metalloprotease domain-containing protein [Amycolatopsis cihanbeyliensis]|uniref:M6 family metalloprotease-like protein n=1 Tax=Amycolatopsis cihanbeyliensis TaxID=1128664 RepID=A0A542CUH8_AMYCI|nr:M6 family metalloprotease domain-containing protein [Amycolatopsis cihanbeyliensis]TQI94450.1 M6 family metalloprotease-like protein [Amycolatopsis cihanbeyliensis]